MDLVTTHLADVADTGFTWMGLVTVLGAGAVVVALLVVVTVLWARVVGKVAVVDTMWGLYFVGLAAAVAAADSGGAARRLLLLALVTAWGLRLAAHVGFRSRGSGEDRRYAELLARHGAHEPRARVRAATLRVFVLQGALAVFIGLPLVVAGATDAPLGWVALLGVLVWGVGVAFETVGDAQLRAFKSDPDNRGRIMDRGLWSWTRHPNYFGDSCVWWGIWLISADAWPGVLTMLSPVTMTYFLVAVSGARLLEQHMSQREGWDDYAERTSYFFPLPPRRSA